MTDLGLRDFGQLGAVYRVDHKQAVIVEGGMILRPVRTVHHRNGNVLAVMRHRHAFRCLADTYGIDDTRRLCCKVYDVDDIDIALPATLVTEHGDIAIGTDINAVRANTPYHELLAVFDLGAIYRQYRHPVITIARY